MAPLSILPGRIRFEHSSLVGKQANCSLLERQVGSWREVQEVRINHRTGRVLVQFDECAICREGLTEKLDRLVAGKMKSHDCSALPDAAPKHDPQGKGAGQGHATRHLLRDMVVHAFLPAPFDLIVPTALAAFRK